MKTERTAAGLARLIGEHLGEPGMESGAEVPAVPRGRLWAAVGPLFGKREPGWTGRGVSPEAARQALAWMKAVEQALRDGCPVPRIAVVEWLEGMLGPTGTASVLGDAPRDEVGDLGLEGRCRAMAREARRMKEPCWDAVAAVLEAWASGTLRGR